MERKDNELERFLESHVSSGDTFSNLYPALVECFGIILLGYVAGRFRFISEVEAKGLSTFIGTFSLPALIFGNLITLDMTTVNWKFLVAIFCAKAIVFLAVLIVTSLIGHRSLGMAGLFAIFTTQSNDFALGYPILKSIYSDHPEVCKFIYLLAPVNLVFLNPIGLTCMEINQQVTSSRDDQQRHLQQASSHWKKRWGLALRILRGILTNPIIVMSILGMMVGTFVVKGRDVPAVVNNILVTLGNAFSATALFLLGLTMVERVGSGGSRDQNTSSSGGGRSGSSSSSVMIIPIVLVLIKIVLLPLIARETVSLLQVGANHTQTVFYSDFAFLYGTFPTAPTVFVFANQYKILPELVASGMVICTVCAAPIMFISASFARMMTIDPAKYMTQLNQSMLDISAVSIVASLWTSFVFLSSGNWRKTPHSQTTVLVGAQTLISIGALVWSTLCSPYPDDGDSGEHQGLAVTLIQYGIFVFGMYASRVNVALLSVLMYVTEVYGDTNPARLAKLQKLFGGTGFVVPFVLVVIIALGGQGSKHHARLQERSHRGKIDPFFQYGQLQAMVSLVLILACLLITVVSLILMMRARHRGHRRLSVSTDPTPGGGRSYGSTSDTQRLLSDGDELEEDVLEGAGDRVNGSGPEPELAAPPVSIEDLGNASAGNTCSERQCSNVQRSRNGRRRYRCDSEHREYCQALLDRYSIPPATDAVEELSEDVEMWRGDRRMTRHLILVIALSVSMFVGLAVSIWTVVMDQVNGTYVFLIFSDAFLSLGQGIITFGCFGLEQQYVFLPLIRRYRRMVYGQHFYLPQWEELDEETKQVCGQFLKHHIAPCMDSVVKDIRVGFKVHRAVFKGPDLVTWLVDVGLVSDRSSGVTYARHLLNGRVIRHVDNNVDFYDDKFIYTFEPSH